MKVVISPKAEEDLVDILVYSLENFGEQKALEYLKSLKESFQNLSQNPEIGRKLDYLDLNYSVFFYNGQAVFYNFEKSLEVIRIIHESKDYMAILKNTNSA
jgi:toxin ParE1/3/4